MEGFVIGLIVAGFILGLILKAVGKHDQASNAIKEGGKSALLWWLSKK